MTDVPAAHGPPPPSPASPAAPAAPRGSPPAADTDRFRGLVGGKAPSGGRRTARDAGAPDSRGRGPSEAADVTENPDKKGPAGQDAAGGLSALFGQAARALAGGLPGPGPGAAMEAGSEAPILGAGQAQAWERCGELVERILVSLPGGGGIEETRLKLSQDWLPDTEVRLAMGPSGLGVEFASDHADARRFLLPHLSVLQDRLAGRLETPVAVSLSEGAAAGGQPGDGRSRNRRNAREEAAQEPGWP